MLASIPSPSESVIELGPLTLRAYGVMIAFGVVAAVLLSQRRWTARGGNPDDISTIALWAVPAGLIGARAYHVLTDWRFDEGWAQPFKIWEAASASRADRCRCARRSLDDPPQWLGPTDVARCDRPRASSGAGDRTLGQLLQPGALRRSE